MECLEFLICKKQTESANEKEKIHFRGRGGKSEERCFRISHGRVSRSQECGITDF